MTDEGPIDRPPPGVSIIVATFNRPDVLAFAIRSVLAQDFQDWEMIVVGDQCAQSTATVIAGFDDPRITYLNLPLRYGDQSGPNNVGIARARGRYLAFLNHDDLWFPDHLSTTIAWLEASGADMVIARAATISRPAKPDETLGDSQWYVELIGHGRGGRYDPAATVAATCMVVKTATARAAPPWTPLSACHWNSSQLWSYQIWRRGFRIRNVPHLTVIKVSASYTDSYINKDIDGHLQFETLMKDPQKLRVLLIDRIRNPRPVWRQVAWRVTDAAMRLAAYCGIPPHEMLGILLLRRRGHSVRVLNQLRGLTPPSPHDVSASELRARYAKEPDSSNR